MQVCRCGGEDLNSKCDRTHLTAVEPSNMVEVRKAAEHAAAAEGRENMPKPSMEKETVFALWETTFGKRPYRPTSIQLRCLQRAVLLTVYVISSVASPVCGTVVALVLYVQES